MQHTYINNESLTCQTLCKASRGLFSTSRNLVFTAAAAAGLFFRHFSINEVNRHGVWSNSEFASR
jgi:hypothetical protein